MNTEKALETAREIYSRYGVDVDAAIESVKNTPVSIQCWQGDDVGGFEAQDGDLTGGIQSTGNYPGKARNIDELRRDFEFASSLIPGKKKFSLHAIYLDADGKKIPRNEIAPEHFASWVDWAKKNSFGLDFNPTFFSHPLSADGFTLSNDNEDVRKFWVEHGIASRKISEYFGRELGQTSVNNLWIPDGFKDIPVNRAKKRETLAKSYAEIFAEKLDEKYTLDSVESKVFGIGLESLPSAHMSSIWAARSRTTRSLHSIQVTSTRQRLFPTRFPACSSTLTEFFFTFPVRFAGTPTT